MKIENSINMQIVNKRNINCKLNLNIIDILIEMKFK